MALKAGFIVFLLVILFQVRLHFFRCFGINVF